MPSSVYQPGLDTEEALFGPETQQQKAQRQLNAQRAVAAMNNSFEALPFFAAAVVIAHQTGAAQSRLDLLAAIWLALRLVYVGLYVANLAGLRSLVWLAGVVTTVWIFVLGA